MRSEARLQYCGLEHLSRHYRICIHIHLRQSAMLVENGRWRMTGIKRAEAVRSELYLEPLHPCNSCASRSRSCDMTIPMDETRTLKCVKTSISSSFSKGSTINDCIFNHRKLLTIVYIISFQSWLLLLPMTP